MKNVKLVGSILLIALALVIAFAAILSPENRVFVAIWDMGIATFRGDASLGIMYIISGFFLVCGILLAVSFKNAK